MRWTVKIGKIYGIPIKIHMLFIALLVFILYNNTVKAGLEQGLISTFLVLLIFLFVTLHEFAHSYQAMKYGITVKEIVLLPVGGVAQIEGFPEDPVQEIKVAVAGPLLNFLASGIIFVIFALKSDVHFLVRYSITSPDILKSLFWINLILGLFNLIPAFPMDGGRILRGLFALKLPYIKATRIAVSIGQGFAILLGIYGLFMNLWLIVISVFIFIGAGSEEHTLKIKKGLEDVTVSQIMSKNILFLEPDDEIKKGLQYIYRGGVDDFPVIDENKIVGIITKKRLLSAIHEYGLNKKVSEIMESVIDYLSPEDKVSDVYLKLAGTNTKVLPVVDGAKIVGMIGMDNIDRYLGILEQIGRS